MHRLDVMRAGLVPYESGLALQAELVAARKAGTIADTLILLQHPPVITLGVSGDGGRSHIIAPVEHLARLGIQVFEAGRGGDVTYHGPGQLVGYPIIDLKPDRCDVHRYVRDVEDVMIRLCADYGITAGYLMLESDIAEDRPEDTQEVTLAGYWQMSEGWRGRFEGRHDFTADRTGFAGLGLAYQTECALIDLSLSRRFTSSTSVTPTTDFNLSVTLGGIGSGYDGRSYRRTCAR